MLMPPDYLDFQFTVIRCFSGYVQTSHRCVIDMWLAMVLVSRANTGLNGCVSSLTSQNLPSGMIMPKSRKWLRTHPEAF